MAAPPQSDRLHRIDPAPSPGRRADVFDPTHNPNAPGAPRALGRQPPRTSRRRSHERPPGADAGGSPRAAHGRRAARSLDARHDAAGAAAAPGAGELPPPPPRNPAPPAPGAATLPPSAPPKDEYDLAYGYVLRKDYALAEDTFRAFLQQISERPAGAADAQYWLGESLFQRQRYRDAAEAFLDRVDQIRRPPRKAPDALLRLGQSLAALGEKEAACASLGEVAAQISARLAEREAGVEREQKRVHC